MYVLFIQAIAMLWVPLRQSTLTFSQVPEKLTLSVLRTVRNFKTLKATFVKIKLRYHLVILWGNNLCFQDVQFIYHRSETWFSWRIFLTDFRTPHFDILYSLDGGSAHCVTRHLPTAHWYTRLDLNMSSELRPVILISFVRQHVNILQTVGFHVFTYTWHL